MITSQNGYPANNIATTRVWTIPGTTRKLRLRSDDCGFLLVNLAAWFDKNIEDIEGGTYDDWGYAERKIRGSSTTLSNHASGTAIDLNSVQHPLGAVNTFTNAQEAAIRQHLKLYEGVIRWGGDYRRRKDEMHFEINKSYSEVERIARKLRATGQPIPVSEKSGNVTIALRAIQMACNAVPISDTYLADARQFLAWCRALQLITTVTERLWFETREARHMVAAVRNVQRHFGLTVDGVFGPRTAGVMKRYGYIPIGLDGKPL